MPQDVKTSARLLVNIPLATRSTVHSQFQVRKRCVLPPLQACQLGACAGCPPLAFAFAVAVAFAYAAPTRHDPPMLRWIALQLRLSSLTSSHATGAEVMHSSFPGRRGRARRLPLTAELWALAWPAILRNVLNCACDRLTLALVGHYDPSTVHYDGAGLGKMYSNITGLSVGLGINLGLATLCSQAYGAGRAADENALHLRRCAVWLVAAFAYSAVAVLFAER